jgi:lysophospholipase L1-like esterase
MKKTLLCLGDSYTIGENVSLHENFPYQTIQLLRQNRIEFHAPEIVAKTGWTSFELIHHINNIQLQSNYDFVTLLIGVNNQYRGLSAEDFKIDFEFLVKKALTLVDNNSKHVIVLSIPDWGVTTFAKDRDVIQISNEINVFNGVCEMMAQKYQTHFINITESTRRAKSDESLLTTDGLHYSAKEHAIWAKKVAAIITATI